MEKTLVKYKNPVEYSFRRWISKRAFPESAHPNDERRFLEFVRNVCSYNARKWKDSEFLREAILKVRPDCDKEWLTQKLIVYESLISFDKIKPYTRGCHLEQASEPASEGYYIEFSFKDGEFIETQKKCK